MLLFKIVFCERLGQSPVGRRAVSLFSSKHHETISGRVLKNAWEADSKIFPELVARTESLLKFFNDSHGMYCVHDAALHYH